MYSLGTLTILRALDHPELVALPVADALKGLDSDGVVGVAEIDEGVSDTLAFCAQYEVPLERAANCVILEATRGDREWLAACVILGSTSDTRIFYPFCISLFTDIENIKNRL